MSLNKKKKFSNHRKTKFNKSKLRKKKTNKRKIKKRKTGGAEGTQDPNFIFEIIPSKNYVPTGRLSTICNKSRSISNNRICNRKN